MSKYFLTSFCSFPLLQEDEILVERYIFCYEKTFLKDSFKDVQNDVRGWLNKELSKIPYYENETVEKKWLICLLVTLNKIFEHNELNLGQHVASRLLTQMECYSTEEAVSLLEILVLSITETVSDSLAPQLLEESWIDFFERSAESSGAANIFSLIFKELDKFKPYFDELMEGQELFISSLGESCLAEQWLFEKYRTLSDVLFGRIVELLVYRTMMYINLENEYESEEHFLTSIMEEIVMEIIVSSDHSDVNLEKIEHFSRKISDVCLSLTLSVRGK